MGQRLFVKEGSFGALSGGITDPSRRPADDRISGMAELLKPGQGDDPDEVSEVEAVRCWVDAMIQADRPGGVLLQLFARHLIDKAPFLQGCYDIFHTL